jgi:hypothetical protein
MYVYISIPKLDKVFDSDWTAIGLSTCHVSCFPHSCHLINCQRFDDEIWI